MKRERKPPNREWMVGKRLRAVLVPVVLLYDGFVSPDHSVDVAKGDIQ